jgi:uncharacterized protein YoxC
MQYLNLQTTQLIIVAAVALTMLLQVVVLLALFFVLRSTLRTLHEEFDETRSSLKSLMGKIEPVVEHAGEFLNHTGPKIESAVTDFAVVAQKLRAQTSDVQVAAGEVIERVRRQGARMDSMMTKTLDGVDRATSFMTDAVGKPMRQLSAVLASAKAVVETLRSPAPEGRANPGHHRDDPDYYA